MSYPIRNTFKSRRWRRSTKGRCPRLMISSHRQHSTRTAKPAPMGQGPTSKGQTHNHHLRPTMHRHGIQNQSHFPQHGNSTRNQQPSYRFVPHLDPHGPIVQKTTQALFNACAPDGPGQPSGYPAQMDALSHPQPGQQPGHVAHSGGCVPGAEVGATCSAS